MMRGAVSLRAALLFGLVVAGGSPPTHTIGAHAVSPLAANAERASRIDVAAIARRAHAAFRDDAHTGVWSGGDTGYASRVAEDGELSIVGRGDNPTTEGHALHFATQSIARGEVNLVDRTEVHRDEDGRIATSRGAGIIERLSNTARGVEQAWEIASHPAGSGDLVVRVDVTGGRYVGSTARGLHFEDTASDLRVAYGAATWIDARGAKSGVAMSYADGAVTMRVDARTVDRAEYPVVIDPLIGTEIAVDQPVAAEAQIGGYGVAAAANGGEDFVVWARNGAAGIYGARLDTSGLTFAANDEGGALLSPTGSGAQVAFDGTNYVIGWIGACGASGRSSPCIARVSPSTGRLLASDALGIDVSGGHAVSPKSLLLSSTGGVVAVAWIDSRAGASQVYAARYDETAGVRTEDAGGVPLTSATLDAFIFLENITFNQTEFLLVWLQETLVNGAPTGGEAMCGARLSPSASNLSSDLGGVVIPSIGTDVALASDGQNFYVGWNDDFAIKGVVVDGSTLALRGTPSTVGTSTELGPPSAVFTGSSYQLLWTATSRVLAARVDTTGAVFAADAGGVLVATDRATPQGAGGPPWPMTFDGTNALAIWTASAGNAIPADAVRVVASTGRAVASDSPYVRLAISQDNNEENPAAAFDGTDYLVAWSDNRANTFVPDGSDVYAARIHGDTLLPYAADATGIHLNPTGSAAYRPSVAASNGAFLVAWETADITALAEGAGVANTIYARRIRGSDGAFLEANPIVVDSATVTSGIVYALVNVTFDGTRYDVGLDQSISMRGVGVNSQLATIDPTSGAVTQISNGYPQMDVTAPGALFFDGTNLLAVLPDARAGQTNLYGLHYDLPAHAARASDQTGLPLTSSEFDEGEPGRRSRSTGPRTS